MNHVKSGFIPPSNRMADTPKPVQPRCGGGKARKHAWVVGTVNTPEISTVKTKLVNVFAMKFVPDLEADTLREFLQQKLKEAVMCLKIDTERKRFSSSM